MTIFQNITYEYEINQNSKLRELFHFIFLLMVCMEFCYSEIVEFLDFPAIKAYLIL